MRFSDLKQDKGVAGLTILLSLIVMLFIIGLIIMIFTLMGNKMRDATYDTTTVAISNLTTSGVVNETGIVLTGLSNVKDCSVTPTIVTNATDGVVITSANYTTTGCSMVYAGDGDYNNTLWNVTGTYTWSADNKATDVMNETVVGISNVTDWFSIFIVIGAMVVLILLTVIIINANKGSGMIEGGTTSARQNVGFA